MLYATELLHDPNLIPEAPGVYFAYFRSDATLLGTVAQLHPSTDRPARLNDFELLYLGASGKSVRDRILKHLKGDSRVSSLRRTIGVLKKDDLCIALHDPGQTAFHFGNGEPRLSAWMAQNSAFDFIPTKVPFRLEKSLIQLLGPPLNLSHRRHHPVARAIMKELCRLRAEQANLEAPVSALYSRERNSVVGLPEKLVRPHAQRVR
jgi:hypothetical protein